MGGLDIICLIFHWYRMKTGHRARIGNISEVLGKDMDVTRRVLLRFSTVAELIGHQLTLLSRRSCRILMNQLTNPCQRGSSSPDLGCTGMHLKNRLALALPFASALNTSVLGNLFPDWLAHVGFSSVRMRICKRSRSTLIVSALSGPYNLCPTNGIGHNK